MIKFLFHENALNLLINISLKFKYFVISFSGSYCDPSSSVFTCDDGHCIPHSFRCDGYHDCWTNEDENDGCLSNVGEYYSMLIMFSGKKNLSTNYCENTMSEGDGKSATNLFLSSCPQHIIIVCASAPNLSKNRGTPCLNFVWAYLEICNL